MSNSCVYSPTGEGTHWKRRKHGGDRPNAKSQRLTSPSQSSSAGRPRKSLSPPKVPPSGQPENFQNEDFGDPAMGDSPLRNFEEEFDISDQILYGMIPGFGPLCSEGLVQSSGSPSQMGLERNPSSTSGPIATETTITVQSSGKFLHPRAVISHPVTTNYTFLARMDSQLSATNKPDYRFLKNWRVKAI